MQQVLGRFSDDIRGAIPGLTQGGPTGYALPIPWAGLSIIAEKIARAALEIPAGFGSQESRESEAETRKPEIEWGSKQFGKFVDATA